MKKYLMLLLAAGSLASAASITLNTYTTGLATSQLVGIPLGAGGFTAGATGGGGLCPSTGCPSTGTASTNTAAFYTFTLTQTSNLTFILQDEFLALDVYDLIVYSDAAGTAPNGQVLSSQVPLFNNTTAQSCFVGSGVDPNATSFNSCLSINGNFPLTAGTYSLSVWDVTLSYMGLTDPFGGGTVPLNNTLIGGANISPSPAHFGLEIIATPTAVPEPGTFAMLGLGGIGLGLLRRRISK